jgi:hypothetical protein
MIARSAGQLHRGCIRILVLTLAVTLLLSLGCLYAPFNNHHTPEPLGIGKRQLGIASSAAPAINDYGKLSYIFTESGFWIDWGVSENSDLRLRTSFMANFSPEDFVDMFIPSISLEYKISSSSRIWSFITGLSGALGATSDGELIPIANPWIGLVFGIGDPGGVRLLLSPRLSAGIYPMMGVLGSLAIGLDLPVTDHVTIRPEACAGFTYFSESAGWLGTLEFFFAWASLGVALVF